MDPAIEHFLQHYEEYKKEGIQAKPTPNALARKIDRI
jgi:hypothetical protein